VCFGQVARYLVFEMLSVGSELVREHPALRDHAVGPPEKVRISRSRLSIVLCSRSMVMR
jgi:hypothetical protein